jgi:glycosyltransferase involved in cell wall biosynthesis
VDLFHATDYVLPRLSKIRSVYTLYDLTFLLFPRMHTPLNRWFLTWMVPRSLKAAGAVIVISEHSRRDLLNRYKVDQDRLNVIYLGVNHRFQPASTGACTAVRSKYHLPGRYLLSVGTLEPRKNFNTLLHVLLRLQKMGINTPLVLAGRKGWRFESFFQQLHRLGLTGQVLLLDYVDEADLPALYSAADLFVFPSLYEGFGLPVLEAMACGTPVVSSNAASLPEVCGEAARLVDPLDVEGWAEAIVSILADPARMEGMRGLGFHQAERFTWEKTAAGTLKVYRQAAGV